MTLHLFVEKRDSMLLGEGEVHLLEPEEAFEFSFALLGLGIDRRTIADLRLIPVVHGDQVIYPIELLPPGSEGAGREVAREWLLFDVIPVFGGVGLWDGGGGFCSWFLVLSSWLRIRATC